MADTPLGEVIERLGNLLHLIATGDCGIEDGHPYEESCERAQAELAESLWVQAHAALQAGQEYVDATLEVWEGQTPESEAWERYRTAQRALLAAYRKETEEDDFRS